MEDRDGWLLSPDGVDEALQHLTPRSAGAIVREAFYGAERFEEFIRRTGLPRSVLAQQLDRLVSMNVLERTPYRVEGTRTRHSYRLTERGRALGSTLIALMDWSQRWLLPDTEPGVLPLHAGCGATVHIDLHCTAGHTGLDIDVVVAAAGPGATRPASSTLDGGSTRHEDA